MTNERYRHIKLLEEKTYLDDKIKELTKYLELDFKDSTSKERVYIENQLEHMKLYSFFLEKRISNFK